METIILTVHLVLALLLVGVVLLQRSEGGGLGMGGGGGGTSGLMTGRQAANALSKLTWLFAVLFICTSLALTVYAARGTSSGSVIDQLGGTSGSTGTPGLPEIELPPLPSGGPATPPAAGEPTPPPALE